MARTPPRSHRPGRDPRAPEPAGRAAPPRDAARRGPAEADWVAGVNAVEGLLQHAPTLVLEAAVQQPAPERAEALLAPLQTLGLSVQRVPAEVIARLSGQERHQGIAVRVRPAPLLDEPDLQRLAEQAAADALFLVLDQVTDPHNVGACIRSAAAAGATAVVFPKDGAASITPVVHRAAAGTSWRLPLVQVTNLARALDKLKEAGVWCYGLALGTQRQSLYAADLRGPIALVLGAEGEGLRELTRKRCDGLLEIPMAPGVESLNVSVTAGICLFEVRRQRGLPARS